MMENEATRNEVDGTTHEQSSVDVAKERAERTLGFKIPAEVAEQVLAYAKRKLEVIKKPGEYLPLLYENELTDHYLRICVSTKGWMNDVQYVRTSAV